MGKTIFALCALLIIGPLAARADLSPGCGYGAYGVGGVLAEAVVATVLASERPETGPLAGDWPEAPGWVAARSAGSADFLSCLAGADAPVSLGLCGDFSSVQLADLPVPAGEPPHRCFEMPPPPGADRLVYSGLLTLLVMPALRSVRHLSAGALPVWLHTAGPHQIGHRVVVDWWASAPPSLSPFHSSESDYNHVVWTVSQVGRPVAIPMEFLASRSGPRSPPSPC